MSKRRFIFLKDGNTQPHLLRIEV